MLTLVGRSLRRIAPLWVGLAVVLAAFQIALVAVAASYEEAGSFDRLAMVLPAFARGSFGTALSSFAGMTTIGYFETLVITLVAQFAIYVATEPAGEIEGGLVDLVLARPLPRHWLVTRTLLVMATSTLALALTMGTATWLGLHALAPPGSRWPQPRIVLTLIAHLVMVAWCFGAPALAAAAWARRRAWAQGSVGLAAIALYLIDFIGTFWAPLRRFGRFSPFYYYQGSAILEGSAHTVFNLTILGTVIVAASALAYWQFGRRDL